MYKGASRFMKSQPVSQFFRDHLNVLDTQEIFQKQSVMEWIWENTKRKGLFFILGGVNDYELVLIFVALFDERRLDTDGIMLAESLIVRFQGKPIVLDDQLKEKIVDGIRRSYDKYRMR